MAKINVANYSDNSKITSLIAEQDEVSKVSAQYGWTCFLHVDLASGIEIVEMESSMDKCLKQAAFRLYLLCTQQIINPKLPRHGDAWQPRQ